jgi:N-acetylglucosamine-6-phosphate deacetylase
MDGTKEALDTIARALAKEGTTAFLATTMTQSRDNILSAMTAVREYGEGEDGARLIGIHLEGPFIAEEYKGAQSGEYVAKPDVRVFDAYNEASGGRIKIVTLAPECEGADALISHLTDKGIVTSIGHTGAKCRDIEAAVALGAKNVTHTYNAQSPLHHREIGTVGSAMLFDELACELIADTIHVSTPAMKLLYKSKPEGKLVLITDAMRAKGLPDGESEVGGQRVFVKNGEARLADGALAGSVLSMNLALKNMIEKIGLTLEQACDLATINPAKVLGIENEAGSIREGKRADFAVLDGDYNVLYTVRGGEIIYKR